MSHTNTYEHRLIRAIQKESYTLPRESLARILLLHEARCQFADQVINKHNLKIDFDVMYETIPSVICQL